MKEQLPSLEGLVVIAFAVAALSILISRAKITSKTRAWVAKKIPPIRYLIYCWFCVSWWITAAFVVNYYLTIWFTAWCAIVGINTVICGVVLFFTPMGIQEQQEIMHKYAEEEAAKKM